MASLQAITIIVPVLCVVATCMAQGTPAGAGPGPAEGLLLAAPRDLRCEYLREPLGIDVASPRLAWEMVDGRRSAVQTAYQILVADDAKLLAADRGNLWDSGRVASDQSVQVEYAGQPLRSRMQAYWKVRIWDAGGQPSPWSEPARWSMGLLDPSDWQAQWIGDAGDPPAALMLRKAFTLPGGVRRATAYVTALGLYELRINGQRVGEHLLAPEWTDYHKRVQYQTFDVTERLRSGENALGVHLGDGWYAGRIGLTQIVPNGPSRGIYGPRPRLLLRLEIELEDGRAHTIVSDESWRGTTEGPIRASDLLDGEVYDARREMPGWEAPGFDDSAWKPAAAFGGVVPGGPALNAQMNEPIRIVRRLKPVALSEPAPSVHVFDLGQNMVGWCRMRLRGPAGTTVTLRHAEVLNPDGTIYTANLRSAAQKDQYTLRGGAGSAGGDEVFEPHFTYHGFRYVEVTGLPGKPALDDLVGCVMYSASPEAGRFECSSALLNKLMENIVWTQRANMPSIPTDCPQRDERLGWMGDILAFAQTGCFNMDMAPFLTKWVRDVRDAQTDDGRYPDFAPHPFDPAVRFSAAPGWADAGVSVPWCAYVNYGDRRLLEQQYDSACKWIEFVRAQNPDLLWKTGRGNDYGDWLNADTLKLEGWPTSGAEVPKEVFATAFFAQSTDTVARIARALGRETDAARYAALAAEIRRAFVGAYVAADGRMQGDTQAGYALALHFDLLPEPLRPAAARCMLEAFDTYRGHISTGFHSTICLMQELTRAGHLDEAYRLVNNRTMPSWGYAIDQGATTIWERWDGFVAGRGFQDPGMNSFSHYALGSVGEWMYRTILGINPDEAAPGYKHFTIQPRPGGDLTWAKGEYQSLHGPIISRWHYDKANGSLTLEVGIPANTSATVYVPAPSPDDVDEGERPARAADGVEYLGMGDGAAVYRVGSGDYRFLVRNKPKK